MSTLSVPLNREAEYALETLINNGYAENKAQAMRKALIKASEDEAIAIVLESQQCAKEGKLLKGDLRSLVR